MNKLRVTSLFSGKGAFEKALFNLKVAYEVINYCEINKFASCAYSTIHNVPEELNLWDITKVDSKKLRDFDLLTYGFPCQDISLAGKLKGIVKGETRSGLLHEALRIIKDKKPAYAIAENVKNLVSKLFINDLKNMLDELDEMGYNSYFKVLNSKDYRSAQSRERVFIVSIRKDVDNGNFNFPKEIQSKLKLVDITEKNIDEKYYCKDNEYLKNFLDNIDRKLTEHKEPSKFGLIRVGEIDNPHMLDMNKRVFSKRGLSPTLTTNSDSMPKVIEYRVRKLTPLECWRLNGFTDEDYWKVKKALEERFYSGKDKADSQMYRLAGNSIVVPVLEEIFKQLLNS